MIIEFHVIILERPIYNKIAISERGQKIWKYFLYVNIAYGDFKGLVHPTMHILLLITRLHVLMFQSRVL